MSEILDTFIGGSTVILPEEENELVWQKFNASMASFCGNVIKSTNQTDKLVCCIVGEGMFSYYPYVP